MAEMSMWTCLSRGFSFTWRPQNLVMLALLLVVQGLAAFLVVSALYPVLSEQLAPVPGASLDEELQRIQPWTLFELQALSWTPTNAALGLGILVYLLVTTFHSAGILTVMRSADGRFRFPRFFSGGGVYFLRFVRLLAILIFSFYVVNWLFDELLEPVLRDYREETRHERLSLYLDFGRDAVQLLAVVFLLLTVEYARIRTVVLDRRSMVLAWLQSLGFVLRHPIRTFSIFGTVAVLDLLVVLLFAWLLRMSVAEAPAVVWLQLGLTLLLFYVRNGMRVWRLATEASFFMNATGSIEAGGGLAAETDGKPASRRRGDGRVSVVATETAGPQDRPEGAVTAPDLEGADLDPREWKLPPLGTVSAGEAAKAEDAPDPVAASGSKATPTPTTGPEVEDPEEEEDKKEPEPEGKDEGPGEPDWALDDDGKEKR